MPIYLLANPEANSDDLETRIRSEIPELQRVRSVAELGHAAPSAEPAYVLLPFSQDTMSIERLVDIASRGAGLFFFIFISHDISANDYKRLMRGGNAEWVSSNAAPQEIREILQRRKQPAPVATSAKLVSFLPSAGGVGNATLAIETGVQMMRKKGPRGGVCLIDLDFQTSHVCDLLDIEPRLKMEEISEQPERLDDQLFGLFVSHHSSGLDVFAASRTKSLEAFPSMEGLDALFSMMIQRYAFILIDLPVAWAPWTSQILGASAVSVVTGLNTIPGLRQVAESISVLRKLPRVPEKILVALNRSQTGLLGRVQNTPYVRKMLPEQAVFYVREDAALAIQSVNTGIPMAVASPSAGVSKDIAKIVAEISALKAQESTDKAERSVGSKGKN